MLARRARFALSSFALPAALACAAVPAARAGEVSPTPEQLARLLAAGLDEDLVAEEGQCGDAAALRDYLAADAGEFAVVSGVFDPGTGAIQPSTRTALRAEREGLAASPFLAFSLFGSTTSRPDAIGAGGFRVHTLRPAAGDPLFNGFMDNLRGDPFAPVAGSRAAGSTGGAGVQTQRMTLGEFKAGR